MSFPADLAVTTEVRVLDVGTKLERVWRLSRAIGTAGVRFERALPFEPGRPVRVELTLPDDERALVATGVVELDRERGAEGEPPAAVVAFSGLDPETHRRLARYVEERTAK